MLRSAVIFGPTKVATFSTLFISCNEQPKKGQSLTTSISTYVCLFETILYKRSYEGYKYKYLGFHITPYMLTGMFKNMFKYWYTFMFTPMFTCMLTCMWYTCISTPRTCIPHWNKLLIILVLRSITYEHVDSLGSALQNTLQRTVMSSYFSIL